MADDDAFSIMGRYLTEAATELFDSYGMSVRRLPDQTRVAPGATPDQSIVAVIGYAGDKVRGALVLVATRSAVESWLDALGENPQNTDLFDTVGEFSNMMLGRLKARLSPQGFPILLSTPTTASGDALRLSKPPGPSSWLAFGGSGWRLDVRIDATFEPGVVLQESDVPSTGVESGEMLLF
ncbi:MAG TPA: chemotaxis protein CheX [Polyangiaceae bacterium]|jgi:CheY-specific phosphatase CheX